MISASSSDWHSRSPYLRHWLSLTVTGAFTATALDAALLQRRRNYFTGGFLSDDHLRSTVEVLLFSVASLIVDAVVVGILVGIALWVSSTVRPRPASAKVVALTVGLTPIFVTDLLRYRLMAYLGDAVDLLLVYELVDRSPGQLLAVASSHVVTSVLMVLGTGALVIIGLWSLNGLFAGEKCSGVMLASCRSRVGPVGVAAALGLSITYVAATTSEAVAAGLRQKPSGYFLTEIVNVLSDIDRDGYALLSSRRDPDPWDSRIFPYAVDVPGNGIDENGVSGDLAPGDVVDCERVFHTERWQSKPNVLLVNLESIRADVVGLVYNGQRVTPTLDRLASRGVSARFAYSHNGFTIQSRYHLFSGRLTTIPGTTTLIDDFKANGYQVAYFSGEDESFGGPKMDIGFDRADVRFDARSDVERRYTTFTLPGGLAVPFRVVQERVNAFLDARTSAQPLFLYVDFEDTHFPYYNDGVQPLLNRTILRRHEISPRRAEELRAMYLNTVANVDRAVGELLEKARGVLGAEPAVIVTADHGESLFEEGFLGHGYTLNDAQTRVPLIAANLPITLEEPIGHADLRHAIHVALRDSPVPGQSPVIREKRSGMVFQYLGKLRRPGQIALTRTRGPTVYDFRTDRVKLDGRGWQRREDLLPSESRAFGDLIRFWESLVLNEHYITK